MKKLLVILMLFAFVPVAQAHKKSKTTTKKTWKRGRGWQKSGCKWKRGRGWSKKCRKTQVKRTYKIKRSYKYKRPSFVPKFGISKTRKRTRIKFVVKAKKKN